MNHIEFLNPVYLLALPLAAGVLLIGLVIHLLLRGGRARRTYGSSYPLVGRIKLWYMAAFALALISLAAARPLLAYGGTSFKRGYVDVAIAIDVSASMWAKDLGPSRLEIAVREALTLQRQGILSDGDRAAVFAFGSTTVRKAHLSTSLERSMDVAGKLRPPEILTGDALPWGSDIGLALEHIYQSIDNQDRFQMGEAADDWMPSHRGDRLVLLFTDGDFTADAEQGNRLQLTLTELRRRGLAVYPIGIGSSGGIDLLRVLSAYERGRDFDDALVAELQGQRTQLSVDRLSALAQQTGGKAFVIDSVGISALPFMRAAVASHRPLTFQLIPEDKPQEVWQRVLIAALVLLALAALLY